jgi:alkyl hydroperoxide reductase subunit F
MLDAAIKGQLKAYLERLQQPIELVASLDDSTKSQELHALLEDIDQLSDKVAIRLDGHDARRPSFTVGRPGESARIRFAGIPLGHEFTSLVLALLQTGGHPPKVEAATIEQIRAISGSFRFETFISLSCHNCPDVIQALNLMAVLNPGISSTMIDGAVFQKEVEERQIMAVPTIYLNGEPFGQGRMTLEEIIARIDTGAAAREAEKIAAKAAFDVLVVGGGPAGAAAASTRRARVCAPGRWWPSVSAARCSTHWRSRTSSRSRKPTGRSWPPDSNSTCATTKSTS